MTHASLPLFSLLSPCHNQCQSQGQTCVQLGEGDVRCVGDSLNDGQGHSYMRKKELLHSFSGKFLD